MKSEIRNPKLEGNPKAESRRDEMRLFDQRNAPAQRSADLQSAVSPIFNRQGVEPVPVAGTWRNPAECNSAIQQTASLRYGNETFDLAVWEFGFRVSFGFRTSDFGFVEPSDC
jgi:hypothetical protein